MSIEIWQIQGCPLCFISISTSSHAITVLHRILNTDWIFRSCGMPYFSRRECQWKACFIQLNMVYKKKKNGDEKFELQPLCMSKNNP